MGGKTWTKTEELLFWRTIIPQSPQAVNMSDRLNSWSQCADMMQEKMGHPRLRKYTKTMLYEHYYQNIKTRRHSPQARPFVREHMKEMNKNPQAHDELSAPAITERSALPASREKNPTAVLEDSVGERHFTAHNTETISSLPRQPCSPFEALLIATKLNQDKKNSDQSSYPSFSMTSASSGRSSFGASSFESSSSGASSFESSSSGTSSSWTSSSEIHGV